MIENERLENERLEDAYFEKFRKFYPHSFFETRTLQEINEDIRKCIETNTIKVIEEKQIPKGIAI